MGLQLGPHNIARVLQILADLSAGCGEAQTGIIRAGNAESAANHPTIAVPTVNGPNATFVDPKAKAMADARMFQGQAMRGIQGVLNASGTLAAVLSEEPAKTAAGHAGAGGKPLVLVGA